MVATKPVVTLEENGRDVLIDGLHVGRLDPAEWHPFIIMRPLSLGPTLLRAIANWLDQQSEKNDD